MREVLHGRWVERAMLFAVLLAWSLCQPASAGAEAPDTIRPVTTITMDPVTPDGGSGWYVTAPDITLASDGVGDSTEYQWDSTGEASWTTYGSSVTPLTGEHILYFRSIDAADNTEDAASQEVKLDTEVPSDPGTMTSSHLEYSFSSDNTVRMDWSGATDGAGESGISGYSVEFSMHSLEPPDSTADLAAGASSYTSAPLADGTWYFHLRTRDVAGNWTPGNQAYGPVVIDTDAPSTTLSLDPVTPDGESGWFISTPDVTLASDEAGSTVYQWDGTGDGGWTAYTGGFAAPSGAHTLYYRSVDTGGATESILGKVIKVDMSGPSLSFASKAKKSGSYVRRTVQFPMLASDGISGMPRVSLLDGLVLKKTDTSSPFSIYLDTRKLKNGRHTFNLMANDRAGNQSTLSRIYRVDNYRPRTFAPRKESVKKGGKVRLYYRVKDPYSNLTSVTVRVNNVAGKPVKTLRSGWRKPGVMRYLSFHAKLRRGDYRVYVYAKDRAGNTQFNIAKNRLIVR